MDVYALATVLYELLAGFTPFGGGHPGAVLRRHVTESVAPLPGIPDELWQLLLQCLAKAPASRLRAPELAARLRELLPGLAGIPPLDIDEPEEEQPEEEQESPAASREEPFHPSPHPGEATPPRGAVPLVQGAVPDSNRETHTSMRVPGPDELAGGAHGTARARAPPGTPGGLGPAPLVAGRGAPPPDQARCGRRRGGRGGRSGRLAGLGRRHGGGRHTRRPAAGPRHPVGAPQRRRRAREGPPGPGLGRCAGPRPACGGSAARGFRQVRPAGAGSR